MLQLDASKNLTSQCVQGCGLVQVNVEIKTILGGSPRINIADVLKPADEDDDDDDVKPDVGMCCFSAELGMRFLSIFTSFSVIAYLNMASYLLNINTQNTR